MSDLSPLVTLISLQFLLYAVGWGLCSLLLREQRAAVAHWGFYMLVTGLGFALVGGRDETRTWWAFVGSNLLFMAGYVALHRGLEHFINRKPRDGEHLAGWLLAALLIVLLGPDESHAPWRVIVAYTYSAWVFVRLAGIASGPLRAEFGSRLVSVLSLPPMLLALASAERVVRQALDFQHPLELQSLQDGNRPLLFAYLIGAALFNFSFMGLLVQRLVGRLRNLSLSDPLTGLLNRRALESSMSQEWQRMRRHGRPMALVALDLDHFKRINDSHGHPAGDAVLKETAQRLRQAARQIDIVARTGGEEFVVLMPDCTPEGARQAAERLRRCIAEQPFEMPGVAEAETMTVSIGVICAAMDSPPPEALMQQADKALYSAKAGGRNRVVSERAASLQKAAA